jgi:hypothetical protein
MKYIIFYFSILIFCWSCTKEESLKKDDGSITLIDSVVTDNTQFECITLENDNFIVTSQSQGQVIKFNSSGKILWKKNVTAPNVLLWNVISIPGTGFATLGINYGNPDGLAVVTVSVYDNDGNFISIKAFNLNTPYYNGMPIFIRLSNGNYAFAVSSNFSNCGYLKILDPDFNLLYSKAWWPPFPYGGLNIDRLGETPDGGVVITASYGDGTLNSPHISMALIVTGPTGNTKSFTVLNDSLKNEISTAVGSYNNGFFAVTSTMIGWETGNGAFINYYGNNLIAGKIGIDRFSHDGQFTGRTEFNDYPGYGFINSIKKTNDGGYILCGTVNNIGSSISVSNSKIYLGKIDANLNKQWSRVIPTIYQTTGAYAEQTSDGGYWVIGNMKSFDKYDKLVLLKTNADGDY